MKHSLSFTAMLSLLLAVAHLARKNKAPADNFIALLGVGVTATIATAYLSLAGVVFETRVLNFLSVPFIYLAGPASYFMFKSTLDPVFKSKKSDVYHFAPTLLVALVMGSMGIVSPQLYPSSPLAYFQGHGVDWTVLILGGAFLVTVGYTFLIYREGSALFSLTSLKDPYSVRVFLLGFALFGALTLLTITAIALASLQSLYWCAFVLSVSVMTLFVLGFRYTSFDSDLRGAIKAKRNKKTTLGGLDLEATHRRLVELMYGQTLYLNEDLNIGRLADEMGLKQHLLSEFLNKYLGVNFAQFVNSFRVHAAKQLLAGEERVDILSVAYRVGFNSKTTFNVSFNALTGMSPREFVKSHRLN